MMWTRAPAGHGGPDALAARGVLAVDEDLDVATDLTALVTHLAVEDPVLGERAVEQGGHGLRLGRRLDLDLRHAAHEVAQHAGQDDANGSGRHTESLAVQLSWAARTTRTSGSWVAMRWNDSPSSADAKTSPLRVPR